jgi:hypothetical protein
VNPGMGVLQHSGVGGAEYISVCVPTFAPGMVHQDN